MARMPATITFSSSSRESWLTRSCSQPWWPISWPPWTRSSTASGYCSRHQPGVKTVWRMPKWFQIFAIRGIATVAP